MGEPTVVAVDPALLFGTIALQTGRLTKEALDVVLDEQGKAPAPLGEICRRRGLLSSNQIRRILQIQKEGAVAEAEMRLGALAVRNGFAREEDIGAALVHQTGASAKLGEILLEKGALSPQALNALLAAQTRLRKGAPPDEELDLETKEVPVVAAPAAAPGDPGAWLILETSGGRPEPFPVGVSAMIGRSPSHEVAVPDMGSSRNHARLEFSLATRQHVLTDLDSRNGTYVNGERLAVPRALLPGDRIRIGDAVFRYAVGPGIALGEPAPEISPPPRARPAEVFRRVLARLAPGVHPQRQLFVLAAWIGMLASFLPWTRHADGAATPGVKGLGLVALVLFAGTIVLALLKDRSRAPEGRVLTAIVALPALVALVGMIRLVVLALDPAASGGIGLHLAMLSGVAVLLSVWLRRDLREATPLPDPKKLWGSVKGAAALAGGTTVRMFRDMTGKRAHEKAVLFRKRDDLLRLVGEAARTARIACSESEAVEKASQELEDSKRRCGGAGGTTPAKDVILARHELKNAELRLERSLQRLGRSVVDRGVPLEPERARIAEVMLLDARVKELS